VESVCFDLTGIPDPETIPPYLNEQLVVDDLAQLEQGINAALAVRFILPEEDTVTVLDNLLGQVRKTLRIRMSKCCSWIEALMERRSWPT
jgi:hypothetical protein